MTEVFYFSLIRIYVSKRICDQGPVYADKLDLPILRDLKKVAMNKLCYD